jgi:signal transduction histidine kinase
VTIRLRLALWYAGSVLALFLLTGLLLRVALHETLEREFERGARRSAALVQGFFRTEIAEYLTVEATILHLVGETLIPDLQLEFVNPNGHTFAVSAITPAGPTSSPVPPAVPLEGPIYELERPLDRELAPGWTLKVHASMAGLRRSLRRIDGSLLLIVPLAALLAAATGWWLTGRTLRPVAQMAAAAERITPATPGARIPVANPHDELGRLARRFNDLVDRLDQALAQQRDFLATAAHELRTPIARMLAQVERALHAPGDGERAHEALQLLHDDLQRTGALVGELLQLARADAGEPAPPLAAGYLDDAVVEAIQPWFAAAERRGVALRLPVIEETPAHFSAEHVGRLLGTLVDNAIRYTPAGGTVAVRVFRDEAGAAVLEVEDTGVGLPEADRARVFERFYRGAEARVLTPEGSGLGLAIARWIVDQHGGHIEIDAAEGGGTLVRVELPAPLRAPFPDTLREECPTAMHRPES